jgi:hypothetical protein
MFKFINKLHVYERTGDRKSMFKVNQGTSGGIKSKSKSRSTKTCGRVERQLQALFRMVPEENELHALVILSPGKEVPKHIA